MGKICAQLVVQSGRNYVEALPQRPQLCVQNMDVATARGKNPHSFTALLPQQPTVKYTGQKQVLTVLRSGLSPVSTLPTITTTTYI